MASRERMVMELVNEDCKLQYDGKDEQRIAGLAAVFTQTSIHMIEALSQFCEAAKAPVDENSVDIMKGARGDAVLAWAALQAATSKIAGVLRIDGDVALERILKAAKNDEEPDVAGL